MPYSVFDGIVSNGRNEDKLQVQVLLFSSRLVLHHKNADGIYHTQSWPLDQINNHQKESKGTTSIFFGEDPEQKLTIVSSEFAQKFNPPVSSGSKWVFRIKNNIGILLFGGLLSILFGLFVIGFWLIPWFVNEMAARFPQKYEIQMGEQMYQSSLHGQDIDTNRTTIANAFLKKMDFETDYPLSVTVVKSEVKNAYAVPGGHIVIYSRLLDEMKSYTELAALLGHEVGHIKRRHTTKSVFSSLSTYAIVSLVFGDISGIVAVVAENVGQLSQLSYSRELEREADQVGFKTLVHNKINPNGMLDLLHHLQSGNEQIHNIPDFLSTHPVTEERLENIQKEISTVNPIFRDNKLLKEDFKLLKGY